MSVKTNLTNHVIGGYRILQQLGSGQSSIYLAEHPVLKTKVAFKIFSTQWIPQTKEAAFFKDAQVLAQLEHPHLCRLLDVGKQKNFYYMVLSYVEGRSLEQEIQDKFLIKWRIAVQMMRLVATGLATAHQKGILHRNIQPSTILISTQREIRITNFELFHKYQQLNPQEVEVGLLSFLSPEQCRREPLDVRSDIYSLGLTLYYALTGKKPFIAPTPAELIQKQERATPISLLEEIPSLPPELEKVVQQMIAKDRNQRYASMTDLIRDLRNIEEIHQTNETVVVQGAGAVLNRDPSGLIGVQFGDFLIEKFLAEGGMAVVYRSVQTSRQRPVALKILKGKLSKKEKMVARFAREVDLLETLNHPHIVSLFGKGKAQFGEEEHYFFAMEFISGKSLRALMRANALSENVIYDIILHTLDALNFAHQRGVIHRDIKPENLLLTPQNQVKITDFGIAHLTQQEEGEDFLTRENVGIGTRAYMAPEQATDSRNVDGRADLYSVGIMFYEMLTGTLPKGAYQPATRVKPQLKYPIDAVLQKAMAQDRNSRFASAKEMYTQIEHVLQKKPDELSSPRSATPSSPQKNTATGTSNLPVNKVVTRRVEKSPKSPPATPAVSPKTPSEKALPTVPNRAFFAIKLFFFGVLPLSLALVGVAFFYDLPALLLKRPAPPVEPIQPRPVEQPKDSEIPEALKNEIEEGLQNKKFAQTLKVLESLFAQKPTESQISYLEEWEKRAYEGLIQEELTKSQWESALEKAQKAQNKYPEDPVFLRFYSQALVPWSQHILQRTQKHLQSKAFQEGRNLLIQALTRTQEPSIQETFKLQLQLFYQEELQKLFEQEDIQLVLSLATDARQHLPEDSRFEKEAILLQAVLQKDKTLRQNAIRLLGEQRSLKAIDPILKNLESKHLEIRQESIHALGAIGEARILPTLIPFLEDPHFLIRRDILKALKTFGIPAQIHLPLILKKIKDSSAEVRLEALKTAKALVEDPPKLIPSLTQTLNDENEQVRQLAIDFLAQIGEPALPALQKALSDSQWITRLGAILTLEKMEKKAFSVVPFLEKKLTDSEFLVGQAARKALKTITGKEYP